MLDTPVGRALIPMFIARLRHERHEAQVAENRRREAEIAEARERARSRMKAVGSIPRRRRAIFERSGGRCHYCACELQLEGRWHIEHKVPRALGGRSVDDNLVAACAPCNLKKRDQTDHEFQARQDGDRT
ncbi:MAG: HNH endonuclease [Burkholderiales bacterium]|nr:HNH endonuclease [Burkholderiales bacterium]